jgi:hypothetical protein
MVGFRAVRVEGFRSVPTDCNASETPIRHHAPVSDTATRLRATSDALMRDLEALRALEEEKRGVLPSDPRLTDLAARIQEIAARVLARSEHQHELTKLVAADPEAAGDQAIEDVERSPAAILAEWRAAEAQAVAVDQESPEAEEFRILADRLREEYRKAFEKRRLP